jgi:hypothetical protein
MARLHRTARPPPVEASVPLLAHMKTWFDEILNPVSRKSSLAEAIPCQAWMASLATPPMAGSTSAITMLNVPSGLSPLDGKADTSRKRRQVHPWQFAAGFFHPGSTSQRHNTHGLPGSHWQMASRPSAAPQPPANKAARATGATRQVGESVVRRREISNLPAPSQGLLRTPG